MNDAHRQSSQKQAGANAKIWIFFGWDCAENWRVVVLTPEGAVSVRTVHRLSEDRRWDAEFISQVRVLHGISNPTQVKELKKALFQKEQVHFLLILQWTYRRECERGIRRMEVDERMSGLSESYERCRALWQPTMMNAENE